MAKIIPQDYPRISDPKSRSYGILDDAALVPHVAKRVQEEVAAAQNEVKFEQHDTAYQLRFAQEEKSEK